MATLEVIHSHTPFRNEQTTLTTLNTLYGSAIKVQQTVECRIESEHLLRLEHNHHSNGDETYNLFLRKMTGPLSNTPLLDTVSRVESGESKPKEVTVYNFTDKKIDCYGIRQLVDEIPCDELEDEDDPIDDDMEFGMKLRADSMIALGSIRREKIKSEAYEPETPLGDLPYQIRLVIVKLFAGIIATAKIVDVLTSSKKIINPKLYVIERDRAITLAKLSDE